MAALACEICGGKLIGRPGGIFECDSCGMEYSTEWAKAKVQEIKGTVKVEGTVEVQGTVRVEGGVSADSLIKRGEMALAEKKWDEAKNFFDQALNHDAENGHAYLGLVMAELKCSDRESLHGMRKKLRRCSENLNYQRARQFADDDLKALFNRLEAEIAADINSIPFLAEERKKSAKFSRMIAAASDHTVGVRSDGAVVAVGIVPGQYGMESWTDIVAVSAGKKHTIGLRYDGTVVGVGYNQYGQCDVDSWTDIVAVSTADEHTVGLKSDGTVVAAGSNKYGQCNVETWTGIAAVSAGKKHTIGLKANGTVVATGYNGGGRCDVGTWTDIAAVSAGEEHTVGLKTDGTVVAVGENDDHCQCEVDSWSKIIAVSAGCCHTAGLKTDGTVVAVGRGSEGETFEQCDVSEWKDIIAIYAGDFHTVGIKADGTVVAAGNNENGECDVSDWRLFNSLDTLDLERAAGLKEEQSALKSELANLKGLFAGKRRREIETRLAAIDRELKQL